MDDPDYPTEAGLKGHIKVNDETKDKDKKDKEEEKKKKKKKDYPLERALGVVKALSILN